MFDMTREQQSKLDNLRSQAYFRTRVGTGQEFQRCSIRDTLTGKEWAAGTGTTENEALDDALKNADPAERPRTPAEMAEEAKRYREQNAELKQRLAKYEGESAEPTVNVDSGQDQQDGGEDAAPEADVSQLSNTELAQAIQSREGDVPGGDKRTNGWREAAEAELKRLQAAE